MIPPLIFVKTMNVKGTIVDVYAIAARSVNERILPYVAFDPALNKIQCTSTSINYLRRKVAKSL